MSILGKFLRKEKEREEKGKEYECVKQEIISILSETEVEYEGETFKLSEEYGILISEEDTRFVPKSMIVPELYITPGKFCYDTAALKKILQAIRGAGLNYRTEESEEFSDIGYYTVGIYIPIPDTLAELQEMRKRILQEEKQIKEEQEKCGAAGHDWEAIPYENSAFNLDPALFECFPPDFNIREKCKKCGAERNRHIEGTPDITIAAKLENDIAYENNIVGAYILKLDLEKSFCAKAKKDIPSRKIKKGEYCLQLAPRLPICPKEDMERPCNKFRATETITDNGDMPALVEFNRYVIFAEDNKNIMSAAEIYVDDNEMFNKVHIGLLRVPDKGVLKAYCAIKTDE